MPRAANKGTTASSITGIDDEDELAPATGEIEDDGVIPSSHALYARLSEPFAETFKDTRGGVELEYITGEQVISRLNEVLGVFGWDFEILENKSVEDEIVVLGQLSVRHGNRVVIRQQFGSQKIKRRRDGGGLLDAGFDAKGASTDALKKCASLFGVGLYLSKRSEQQRSIEKNYGNGQYAEPITVAAGESLGCEECGSALQDTRFRDGSVWTAADLAKYGTRKYGRKLCMEHYRAAKNGAAKAAPVSASADLEF